MTAHDRGTIGQARNEAMISQEPHPLDLPDCLKVANRDLPLTSEQREVGLLMQQRWETMRQQKAEKSTPVPADKVVSAATLSPAHGEAGQTIQAVDQGQVQQADEPAGPDTPAVTRATPREFLSRVTGAVTCALPAGPTWVPQAPPGDTVTVDAAGPAPDEEVTAATATPPAKPSSAPEVVDQGQVQQADEPAGPDAPAVTRATPREFLSRVLPWPNRDEAPGYGNIHWTFTPDDGGDPRWAGKAFRNAAEATSFVEWLKTKPSTRDIYFCLSQQSECKPGKRPGSFVAVRKGGNALLLKSLWLDIDVKAPPNGYASPAEAVRALTVFRNAVGLPRPSALIKSGGGLHVYWINKGPLTLDQWRPLADALKNAAEKHGLRCDACCTVDPARILRVPGTWNCKTEPRRPVQLVWLGEDYDF
jgi:hypothetical protein